MPGILIVDDYSAIRDAVRSLLAAHSLDVCGEAADGKAAIEKASALRPELILLDILMPIMNGIDVAREIRRILPETKIVFLTMYEALAQGTKELADGFVTKSEAAKQLVPAVKAVLEQRQRRWDAAGAA